ncbi:MAG: hypothetical protein Q9169_007853 [Polycauliona sp. 2 TL-2023]
MTTDSSSHEERTAAAKREADLHPVRISKIEQVNESVRLLRLSISSSKEVKFLPGQWLDVHLPGVRQAGGFTITSTPKDAQHTTDQDGYLELAIQKSPNNPPAAWLWRPEEEIRHADIYVRVGGNFVWPPPGIDPASIKTIAFVAGGVGINPLMSILSHLHQNPRDPELRISLIYSTHAPQSKDLSSILFLNRLRDFDLMGYKNTPFVKLYLTQCSDRDAMDMVLRYNRPEEEAIHSTYSGRIDRKALRSTVDHGDKGWPKQAVVYICGPPGMTDEFEQVYLDLGIKRERILTEKWW